MKHCNTVCCTKQAENYLLAEVMKFECRDCNTVCATKEDFVLQYVRQIWEGDFRAMSREILLRALTNKNRMRGWLVWRERFR